MLSHQPSIREAALGYLSKGFSIIPCVGKRCPLAQWTPYMERLATAADVESWGRSGRLQNVAIICGRVSGNLVVIDLDGDEAVSVFSERFPHLMQTYVVQSGSGHGAHVYLRSWALPTTSRALALPFGGNIELRANGHYVVAPPSIHPDTGNPYTVLNRRPILRVDDLDNVMTWIDALKTAKRPVPMPTRPATEKLTADERKRRWAVGAMRAEAAAVRHAPKGQRNATLNRAAFKMGQLMSDGLLRQADVEQELMTAAAALVAEDGDGAVLRTIHSGITAGMNNPRTR